MKVGLLIQRRDRVGLEHCADRAGLRGPRLHNDLQRLEQAATIVHVEVVVRFNQGEIGVFPGLEIVQHEQVLGQAQQLVLAGETVRISRSGGGYFSGSQQVAVLVHFEQAPSPAQRRAKDGVAVGQGHDVICPQHSIVAF